MRRKALKTAFLSLGLVTCGAAQAAVDCPAYSVTLIGSQPGPLGMGTYSEELTMIKTGGGAGVNGRWQVKSLIQTNTYPWDLRPPVNVVSRPEFSPGITMECRAISSGNVLTSTCSGGNMYLDVVGGRIGWIATDVWIGKIEGNFVTLQFHDLTPVDTGTLQKGPGQNLDLKITSPAANQRYVFSDTTPGTIDIELTAAVTPSSLQDRIEWKVPQVDGATVTTVPADRKGRTLRVTYEGLPANNAGFGKTSFGAKVDGGTCEADAQVDVRLFFPRDATNNPAGAAPNWFYYWRQTSAGKGPSKYGGSAGACDRSHRADGTVGYYRHEHLDSVYYICDLAPLGASFPFNSVYWKPIGGGQTQLDNRRVTGIDTFAVAARHENAHYEHFKTWWFSHRVARGGNSDQNRNSINDAVEGAKDVDGDLVPDALEPGFNMGLDPTKKFSHGTQDDDEEVLTWAAEAEWAPGSADEEDWAHPGKQWP